MSAAARTVLEPGSLSAVVLAGGLGTRLRSVVADRPKVLALVNGRPFLAHLLDQLAAAGIRRVILSTGYGAEQVEAAFGRAYESLRLEYSRETQPLGTGGALRLALPLVASEPVLVLNGDSYSDFDAHRFLAWHRARRGAASLWLTRVDDRRRYGAVQVHNGAIERFEEKSPAAGAVQPGWINAGVYLLSRRLLESIPADRPVSIEREVFPAWVGRGLYGYQGGGRLLDIGTPESYAQAEAFLAGLARREPPRSPRVVLLDRDGVLNVELHYLSEPDQVELLPGVAPGLRQMRQMGLRLAVVTNQSGIGRGYFDGARLETVHGRLRELLRREGVELDGIYCCPHVPEDDCSCRKPRTGLAEQAARELDFDPRTAFVIGDKACDIDLGRAIGATTILATTGYGAELLAAASVAPDYVVDDLVQAARVIGELVRQD